MKVDLSESKKRKPKTSVHKLFYSLIVTLKRNIIPFTKQRQTYWHLVPATIATCALQKVVAQTYKEQPEM